METCTFYVGNITIISKTSKQHADYFRKVLSLIYNAGTMFKLKNCNFFTNTIEYLRHVTRTRHLEFVLHATYDIHGLSPFIAPAKVLMTTFLVLSSFFQPVYFEHPKQGHIVV